MPTATTERVGDLPGASRAVMGELGLYPTSVSRSGACAFPYSPIPPITTIPPRTLRQGGRSYLGQGPVCKCFGLCRL